MPTDEAPSTPPPGKKRKIGGHGESPPITPDMYEDEEHGPRKRTKGRPRCGRGYIKQTQTKPLEQMLKNWGLHKEFTVCGGKMGCITCMKYDAWCEQEGAVTIPGSAIRKKKQQEKKKKKRKKEKKEKKKEKKEKKQLLMDEGEGEGEEGEEGEAPAGWEEWIRTARQMEKEKEKEKKKE